MSGFFEEVQRRKVYRVVAAYIVAAGFIIQIASVVFPAWELPNWSLRLIIVLLLLGFPLAAVLAWAYDITPRGIESTPAPTVHRKRNLFLLIGSAVVLSGIAGFFLLPRAAAHRIDKSIAVLPFENLSAEKESAYFADGIQDDILTNLAKIGDLKVISRTSVMSYRAAKNQSARDIGRALGVSTLLEGSVRRIGNRVHVNVQLIDAEQDQHLWAEEYERDLTDVFTIQTDLARKIAASLQAKLSPNETSRLERRPTENPEAYLLFVRANDYANRLEHLHADSLRAEELFEQAIKVDPNFAAAFAGLSIVESSIYHNSEPTPGRREEARLNADESLRLQPNLPEGHLALGFYYYYGERDYDRALREFEIAKLDLPNEAQAYLAIGAIQRRQGKWAESTANLEKAAALDPKNGSALINLAFSYMALRNFEAAEKTLDRVGAVTPQSFAMAGLKAYLAVASRGDLRRAEKLISSLSPEIDPNGMVTWAEWWVFAWERKFPEALAALEKFPGETLALPDSTAPAPKAWLKGIIHLLEGNTTKAQSEFEKARLVSEKLRRDAPDDAGRHAQHGLILAALHRKEEAIAEGKRAVELLPESEDAFAGPQCTAALAQIYGLTGESDEAFALIEHLLSAPNGLTVSILKLDPIWDPLRKDPRFQTLLDNYASSR